MMLSSGFRAHEGTELRGMVVCNASKFARLNNASAATIHDMGKPFAQGSFRWVANGTYTEGSRKGEKCVCKWFKTGAVFDESFFEMDIKAVDKAQGIIEGFNNEEFITQKIYLNQPGVWWFQPESSYAGQRSLIEPFIENFQKFNSNSGVISGDEQNWSGVMQALSHYSYHKTGGQYVLCDLQGGIQADGSVVLTDPVILSQNREYGVTDLGREGISTFFARHRCSRFCRGHWQMPAEKVVHFQASVGTTMVGMK